ncbi:MAG: caspase family protein [Deltaproteobacteria bacterium]|nr:caspase family protein [Deltaproteobacteria bacterium]
MEEKYNRSRLEGAHNGRFLSIFHLLAALLLPIAPVPPASAQAMSPQKATPELVLQTGHTSRVSAMAFSPDGHLLASGTNDTTVKLWEVSTGRELRTLSGHTGFVLAVAFSTDGRLLASAGGFGDNTVKFWEVETGRHVRTLTLNIGAPRGGGIRVLGLSPDNRFLAASGWADKTIRLWDLDSGRELYVLSGHADDVLAIDFSRKGQLLASGGSKGAVKLWEVATGQEVRTLAGHTGEVHVVAFTPDGSFLASGSSDKRIKVWNVSTGREMRSIAGYTSQFHGSITASFGEGEVKLWEVATGRQVVSIPAGHRRVGIQSLAFTPDGCCLALGAVDGVIKLWELATGRDLRTLSAKTNPGQSLAVSPSGKLLVSAGAGVTLWEAATGWQPRTLDEIEPVWSLAFSPDGELLASGDEKTVRLSDLATGRNLRTLSGHTERVLSVAFSPDGRWLTSGSWDKTVRLWDVASGREVRTLAGHTGWILAVAFSPDGRWLATGSLDGMIKLSEVVTGRELRAMGGPTSPVRSISFSPDGRFLASGHTSLDNKVLKVWEVATGREVQTFSGHTNFVQTVAFSPDGGLLASGSGDNTVRLWDVATGREVRTLIGHRSWLQSVAFSPDGRWLASISLDGSTRIWDVETGEQLAALASLREGSDWLVVTPDGLFDGSPEAWNQILWRFGGNTFDVAPTEVFFNEFYYPGLLADIMTGKRPKAPKDISQLDRRQPQIKLALADGQSSAGAKISSRTVKIQVEVAEAPADKNRKSGSGARDVRLFRNGSLVKVWRGNVLQNKGSRVVLEATLPIVAGENRLVAYAFNRDNIKSADTTLVVTGSESLKRPATAYILAVGINEYANRRYNLRYAVADAQVFGEELKRQQSNLGTFSQFEVIPLLNQEATRANILLALKRLSGTETGALPPGTPAILSKLKPAEPEDTLFVYFAGHGIAERQRFYLVPHDMGYRGPRTELNEAGLKTLLAHSISDLELEQAFEKIDAGRLLFVIDACNSGQALEAEEKRRGPMNSKGLAQLAYEKGMYILTAAQGYQAALEAGQLGHGLLTYALVEEGLKSPAADSAPKDGQVVVKEWLDYATTRVPQMQTAMMKEGRSRGQEVVFVDGEEAIKELEKRSLQHPRVFYRREVEAQPLVVAKPEGK